MLVANSKVGAEVAPAAVIEVAERLQLEGLSRLEVDPEAALVVLRQAFLLERQFGNDNARLCAACSSLCRALLHVPSGLSEAVTPLLQTLETLETRCASPASPAPQPMRDEHRDFVARELLGLARKLTGEGTARLDELRAADRAFERLAQLAKVQPLCLYVAGDKEVVLTQEEVRGYERTWTRARSAPKRAAELSARLS